MNQFQMVTLLPGSDVPGILNLEKSIFEFWPTLSQRDHLLEKTIKWMIDRMIVCFQLVLS